MKCTRSGSKLSAALLAAALWPCAASFAQDYEIRLHRPDVVGNKYHLSSVGKQSVAQTVKQGDKVIQEQNVKFTVEAELVMTVTGVSENGRITKARLEIEKLTRTEGDAKRDLAPKGSVITAALNGEQREFEMNGSPLEPDTQDSLKLLDLVASDLKSPTDDELFGTKDRKKVGDHWEGNNEVIAKDMARHGLTTKKEDFKSSVTLEKIVTLGTTECVQLSGSILCEKFSPPLPAGFIADKSVMKLRFASKLPAAANLSLPCEGSSELSMDVVARGKPDPIAEEIIAHTVSDRSLAVRVTEAK